MPKVTFVLPDGSRQEIEVELGQSVMQAATSHGIDGIVAECGGAAMCATCHVYVQAWGGVPPVMNETEDDMLDCTVSPRRENSRLSCQLVMSESLGGLVVQIPQEQV